MSVNEIPPRVRMFAGPNGSGKSRLKKMIADSVGEDKLYTYINADEIEKNLHDESVVDLMKDYADSYTQGILEWNSFIDFVHTSTRMHDKSSALLSSLEGIKISGSKIDFSCIKKHINSYLAGAIADWMRLHLSKNGMSFSFETVMSHQSKIDDLHRYRNAGYRVYLYFITTQDPEINVRRVENRFKMGGHYVDPETVKNRYYKSLDKLYDAVLASHRAFMFDNSEDTDNQELNTLWYAEWDGKNINTVTELSKIQPITVSRPHILIA